MGWKFLRLAVMSVFISTTLAVQPAQAGVREICAALIQRILPDRWGEPKLDLKDFAPDQGRGWTTIDEHKLVLSDEEATGFYKIIGKNDPMIQITGHRVGEAWKFRHFSVSAKDLPEGLAERLGEAADIAVEIGDSLSAKLKRDYEFDVFWAKFETGPPLMNDSSKVMHADRDLGFRILIPLHGKGPIIYDKVNGRLRVRHVETGQPVIITGTDEFKLAATVHKGPNEYPRIIFGADLRRKKR